MRTGYTLHKVIYTGLQVKGFLRKLLCRGFLGDFRLPSHVHYCIYRRIDIQLIGWIPPKKHEESGPDSEFPSGVIDDRLRAPS